MKASACNISKKIKAMIVDDASIIRGILNKALSSSNNIEVVASATNGEHAIEVLQNLLKKGTHVDIITLDVEMPGMDGITALPKLLEISPDTKVIMVSTITQDNAEVTVKALSLGAADYLPKPTANNTIATDHDFTSDFLGKIEKLCSDSPVSMGEFKSYNNTDDAKVVQQADMGLGCRIKALAIGSSTGGPQALIKFFRKVNKNMLKEIPVFVVQHMPAVFTTFLAKQINEISGVACMEAKDGEEVRRGMVYMAPGDYHMVFKRDSDKIIVKTNKEPPVNFCRPAVDTMLDSLAEIYGNNLAVIIMTGMGHDGLSGCKKVVENNGLVIAQDELSSVVWGMPGAVVKSGLCKQVVPIDDMGEHFYKLYSNSLQKG